MQVDKTRIALGAIMLMLIVSCNKKQPPLPTVETMDTSKIHCMDVPKVSAYSSDYYPDTLFSLNSAEVSRKDPDIKDGHYIIYYDKAFTHKTYAFDVKNGWRDGHHVYWYRNGQKRFEGYKDNRVDTGFYTTWNREGEQQLRRYYQNDSASVTIYEYYPSGALKLEAVSKGHERIEERTFYENGNRESETFYEMVSKDFSYARLTVFWDSSGKYDHACRYDYKIIPDTVFPGEFSEIQMTTDIQKLKME